MQRFAVAITTAPRHEPSLHRCIASISGQFPSPIVSYDDGALGAAGNLLCAVRLLIERSDANWLLVLQDDAIASAAFRERLELLPPPGEFVSPYCAGYCHKPNVNGWHHMKPTQGGAVAYLFGRRLAQNLALEDWSGHLADTKMMQWANARGVQGWTHSPSLVQHVGQHRAIGYKPGGPSKKHALSRARRAADVL